MFRCLDAETCSKNNNRQEMTERGTVLGMDVDLLRPGTVPISPDTLLWFEFLLDPGLLRKHLEKPTSDPTPPELIVKFLSIAFSKPPTSLQETPGTAQVIGDGDLSIMSPTNVGTPVGANGGDTTKPVNRRSRALKILALKVAAYLDWDLGTLETKLPVGMQSVLLRELLSELTGGGEAPPLCPPPDWDPASVAPHVLTGLALYHRWVVRSYFSSSLNAKLNPKNSPGIQQQLVADWPLAEITEAESERSVGVLGAIVRHTGVSPAVPSFDCFVPLTDELTDVEHRWDLSLPVSSAEFNCQLLMDISNYFMYREGYRQARESLQECLGQFKTWKREQLTGGGDGDGGGAWTGRFCEVTHDMITGSCIAVGIRPANYCPSLIQQFHTSVTGQYIGIDRILDRDNVLKEIPLMYRDCLELDVASEAASGKLTAHRDGMVQIQASNMVRRALAGHPLYRPKVTPTALHKALIPVLPTASDLEKGRLKHFLLELLASCDSVFMRELSEQPTVRSLLTEAEIQEVQETDYTDPVPVALLSNEIESLPEFKNKGAEIAAMERHLISTYDPQEIKSTIVKLMSASPDFNVEKICLAPRLSPPQRVREIFQATYPERAVFADVVPQSCSCSCVRNPILNCLKNQDICDIYTREAWGMPTAVQNSIGNLGGGLLQCYVFVLMAKSFELVRMKNFGMARTFLRVVGDEMARKYSLAQSVRTKLERLVSWELLLIDVHQFHAEWPAKNIDWQSVTHGCIGVLLKTDGGNARPTLYEQCALALLNAGQWQQLVNLPPAKGNTPTTELYISLAMACLDINKYNKKISTEAWDKLLPVFVGNQKRRNDSLNIATAALCSVVELNALAVVVSLLANLHNVLNNQPQLDLYVYSTHMWPSAIKNANQYSIRYVSEVLYEVLNHALRLYPYNVAWLKLHGDLHFCNNNFSAALKFYLKAAIAGTDYFSRPIARNIVEDHIFKRMIKCCSQVQCHTQAAVLCQFLEDVDYATAFKSLSESWCADAMDTYFDCVWDITVLEFLINLYSKRGEHYRKQRVIGIIGLLELNSNNNDEIKREAENIRKAKFLRSMAKQYIC
ncbi:hypothetical protein AAG570_006134 [Ranatra chinensis]|uniref:INTS8 TPR repeats domain-containing protein n=2 Tax=Ranatra chinensis TaxID=642074 RepID=A0ABD0YIV5_9HEMI